MPISVSYSSLLTVIETLGGAYVSSGDNTVTFNGMDATATLNSASTPPATKYSSGRLAVPGDVDFTSLPDVNGVAAEVDFSGLKVSAYKVRNLPSSAGYLVFSAGSYELHGSTWEVLLFPGEEMLWKGVDAPGQPDVGGSTKTLGFLAASSATLEFEFVAG